MKFVRLNTRASLCKGVQEVNCLPLVRKRRVNFRAGVKSELQVNALLLVAISDHSLWPFRLQVSNGAVNIRHRREDETFGLGFHNLL